MTDHTDLIAKLRFCARLHPQVGYPENGKLFAASADALEAAEAEKSAAVEAALREAAAACDPTSYAAHHASVRRRCQKAILALIARENEDAG